MSAPKYETHDPRGWGGDPTRGAALGRQSVHVDSPWRSRDMPERASEPAEFCGRVALRHIPLNSGGYDRLGTYWGRWTPLYWCGAEDADGNTLIDWTFRAHDREEAKEIVRSKYPKARFYR